jgi:hypothetical protein
VGGKLEAILNFAKGAAFRLSGLLPVNCEAEIRVTCILNGGIQEAKPDSRAKFGKESIAGAHGRPRWVPHCSAQADSGRVRVLRLCSGCDQAHCSD